MNQLHHLRAQTGSMLVGLLVFIVAFATLGLAVGSMIVVTLGTGVRAEHSEQAFNAAEAGLNYYLWHLNHDAADQRDGQSTPATPGPLGYGPYVHTYQDNEGNDIGTYTLYILPGASGSTTVTVRSIGKVSRYPSATRTVEAKIGAPSFSTFAVAGNTALWFGNTESTSGPVHSNIGIKMDGSNTDQITSARSSYTVPSWSGSGAGTTKAGVWCDTAITSPVNCNSRNKTSWSYPVPAVDFNKISGDLCALKKIATNNTAANACTLRPTRTSGYIPAVSASPYSATVGYLISLNDNGTYNLEQVSNERDTRTSYATALTRTTVAANVAIPAHGVIFVEDNVWVRSSGPTGFNGRVTIASARLGVTGTSKAVIAGDIEYADKYNGNDAVGIVAQGNVEVAPYVNAPVEINGALISQAGSVGIRQKYVETGNWVKGYVGTTQGLTFFGSLASNLEWTWSVLLCGTQSNASCWAGYRYTTTVYDENLRYAPPPNFPVTSSFDMLSWREVLTTP
ncbi:MAG TPA: hypothetical protein VF597_03800 [Candidatus Saccharimonadales bacterium]|jgi:hypothetical protein